MKDKTLNGLKILVTRSMPAALTLFNAIKNLHGEPILCPAIDIAPPKDSSAFNFALNNLADYSIAIFTSRNAVTATIPKLMEHWPSLPAHLHMFAIGKGTAESLIEAGVKNVNYPSPEFNSEALLAMPELSDVKNKKIIIFCGDDARPLLPTSLKARGANILEAFSYQRILPTQSIEPILTRFKRQQIDAIICTSNAGLNNLYALIDNETRAFLLNTLLIVTSKNMLNLAHELQFLHPPVLARDASDAAIIEALLK